MLTSLFHSIQSERLKLRRSLLGWLILAGGLFVPAIMFAVRLHQRQLLPAQVRAGTFWRTHWTQSWESISILILPLMVVLIVTLVVQIEFRNNTWKQVHASPQALATIFLAKLALILAALLQLFLVLNAGLALSGGVPVLLAAGVPLGASPFPVGLAVGWSARFFVDALPVVALQYLLALRCRSFLVPVGVGVAGWIFGLVLINTRYNLLVPYGYSGVDYLVVAGYRAGRALPVQIQLLSGAAFAVAILAAYFAYAGRKDKGS